MAGDAGQGIDMERCLGQPFGMALNRLGIFVTFGALDVDVTPGYRKQGFHGMRFMTIGAIGILFMHALIILGKYGCVTILAFCPRWSDFVSWMTFRDIVMAGNTPDS